MLRRIIDRCDTKEQRKRMLRWIKGVTLRDRERGMRMLRWINGVTLRNRERERERNENVEVDQGCNTKEQRERGMRMLR